MRAAIGLFFLAMMGVAAPARAHPHVYVDTGIEVIFDAEGRAVALRLTWTYDEMLSLSQIADRGLDADWDGALTEAEVAQLSGFDMNWDPGFAGDTYALMGEAELPLGGPSDWTAGYKDGLITSTHIRRFQAPVVMGADPLIVQVYDPGFYTAYSIAYDPVLTGRGDCTAQAFGPDVDAADEALKAALSEYSASQDVEVDFPAVGKNYAEEVRVTCGGG